MSTVKLLLQLRGAIDPSTKAGRTPLWGAACSGQPEVVRYLASLRASVHVDCEGWTPMRMAHKNPDGIQHEVIDILKEYGATIPPGGYRTKKVPKETTVPVEDQDPKEE